MPHARSSTWRAETEFPLRTSRSPLSGCADLNRAGTRQCYPLLTDCLDPETGKIEPLTILTDNGPAYKSTDSLPFIAGRPELRHVRTRHHAPDTNGVVERFKGSLKHEHLYRLEIPDARALADEAEAFRRRYNEIRPHEALDVATPLIAISRRRSHTYLGPKVSKNLDAGNRVVEADLGHGRGRGPLFDRYGHARQTLPRRVDSAPKRALRSRQPRGDRNVYIAASPRPTRAEQVMRSIGVMALDQLAD
jgi:hypothetical protein